MPRQSEPTMGVRASLAIERKTRRRIIMASETTPSNLAKCHPQASCLLFQLPQERRDLILAYSSAQYDEPGTGFSKSAYYYRPGYIGARAVFTGHLLTCRRLWLEAHSYMRQAEHTFWFSNEILELSALKNTKLNKSGSATTPSSAT